MIINGELFRAELFDNKGARYDIDQLYALYKDKFLGKDCYVFNMHWQNGDGTYCGNYKVSGKVLSEEYPDCIGFGWSGNERPVMGWWSKLKNKDNFVCTMPLLMNGEKQDVSAKKYGEPFVVRYCARNSWGFDAGHRCTILAGDSMTPGQAQDKLLNAGVIDAICNDGGGSTQGRGPNGLRYDGESRFIYSFLILYLTPDTDDTPEKGTKMKVCLDAGHGGTDCTNGSPDGTYKEHEFSLDMAQRVKTLLEPYVEVIMTRSSDITLPLSMRTVIANKADADLYVSLHSNAANSDNKFDGASGLCVFTYAAGGRRNVLAKNLLAQFKKAGATLFGSQLYHRRFHVLAHTNMPAALIEYSFHDNWADLAYLKSKYWRGDMAKATAKGILDTLGIAYTDQPEAPATPATDAETAAQKLIAAGYGDILIALADKI